MNPVPYVTVIYMPLAYDLGKTIEMKKLMEQNVT
jgi:hypothetical protein